MLDEIDLEPDYEPSESEEFMNEKQKAFFRKKLNDWKQSLLIETKSTVVNLQGNAQNIADISDRASAETDRALELRTRDRERKLISKIESAIRRIDDDEYGYCDDTGNPISLKRLIARPIATLSLEAQERHERRERVFRDD